MLRCLCLLCFGITIQAALAADNPNILFIAIDDQNDWIGCLGGHPQAQTPNIDRLASRGTLFTNAHCQSPLCNSSRTSLMTGLRPDTTGIYGLAPWFRNLEKLKNVVSLPQYLRQHGYTASSAGKVYHGNYGRGKNDDEFDSLGPATSIVPRPDEKLVKDVPQNHPLLDWGVFPHQDEDKGDWQIASWAVDELSGNIEEPFFLSAGFFLPHVPIYVTQKWYDMYPAETLLLPPVDLRDRDDTPRFSWYLHWTLPEPRLKYLQESNQWTNIVRSYLAATSFVDSQVGRILDALDASGKADNTIIVLWSDHGWHLGEKLITGKNTLWDDSTRVPLIFAGPGVAAGARCHQPAELLDIYPTLIDLCGLPKKSDLDGHSLLPQMQHANAPREWPAITTHNHDNHGIRTDRWRFIQYADGSEELYEMSADPNEWHNLATNSAYADVLTELRQWIPDSNPPAPGSAHRILLWKDGQANWEGKDISPDDPIPDI